MGKIFVFIFDEMTDYEVTFLMHLLGSNAGNEIVTVSYEDQLVKGKSGFMIKPSKILGEVLEEEVEGLIIPGGWNGDARPELLELIDRVYAKGSLIGGICGAGTVYLAKAGILNHVKYSTPVEEWTPKHKQIFGEEDPFPRENYLTQRVVRDRNVITAHGIAFVEFAVEICDWYGLFDNNQEKEEFLAQIRK